MTPTCFDMRAEYLEMVQSSIVNLQNLHFAVSVVIDFCLCNRNCERLCVESLKSYLHRAFTEMFLICMLSVKKFEIDTFHCNILLILKMFKKFVSC